MRRKETQPPKPLAAVGQAARSTRSDLRTLTLVTPIPHPCLNLRPPRLAAILVPGAVLQRQRQAGGAHLRREYLNKDG